MTETANSEGDMAFDGFSTAERSFLAGQRLGRVSKKRRPGPSAPNCPCRLRRRRLGRLATVSPTGIVGNAPVTFFVRSDDTVDIGGNRKGSTKRFRNVADGSRVAFVVDDLAPGGGWHPRNMEIRGTAEALSDVEPPARGFSAEVIKIHPDWVRSFGLENSQ
jgi:pyridoxamine 5'-phosphate oxidase family protein